MKANKMLTVLGLVFGLSLPALADDEGRELYSQHCATCHQADGGGVPFMNPPLIDSVVVQGDPETLALWVLTGNSPDDANYESDYEGFMPGFQHVSDEDIAAILTYVRQSFGGSSSVVKSEDIKRVRN